MPANEPYPAVAMASPAPVPQMGVLDDIHKVEDQLIQRVVDVVHARVMALPYGAILWTTIQQILPVIVASIADEFDVTPKNPAP